MTQTVEEKNKALVLEAFETLFNKKDYAAAERFWSPSYIQHSKHIPPGRGGSIRAKRYENGAILAEGNLLGILSAASLASVCRQTGLWWISCVWRTASWPSIGTSSKTRPRARHPSATYRCSGRHFRWNDPAQLGRRRTGGSANGRIK